MAEFWRVAQPSPSPLRSRGGPLGLTARPKLFHSERSLSYLCSSKSACSQESLSSPVYPWRPRPGPGSFLSQYWLAPLLVVPLAAAADPDPARLVVDHLVADHLDLRSAARRHC